MWHPQKSLQTHLLARFWAGIDLAEESHHKDEMAPADESLAPAQTTATTATDDIEYLYLDFSTELPVPNGLASSPSAEAAAPPPCPDLKKYTSPFLWSNTRKSLVTWLACGVTTLAAYSAGQLTPTASQLLPLWNISSVAFNTGITVFCFGFAIAPMVLAPFSEINGRRPVFIASGVLFTGKIFGKPVLYSKN